MLCTHFPSEKPENIATVTYSCLHINYCQYWSRQLYLFSQMQNVRALSMVAPLQLRQREQEIRQDVAVLHRLTGKEPCDQSLKQA